MIKLKGSASVGNPVQHSIALAFMKKQMLLVY